MMVARNLPQVKVYWATITQVLFPAHAFKVQASGFSGPSVVRADDSIDFGSIQSPKVFRGNECKIELQPRDLSWRATAYRVNENCAPTTTANAPFAPLPTYSPKFTTTPSGTHPLPPPGPFKPIRPIPQPVPKPTPTAGDGSRTYLATDKGVYYTNNFLASPPTWAALNGGLTGAALDVISFFFDPWSSNKQFLSGAYAITWDGVYKNSNLPTGSWTKVLSATTVNGLIAAGTVNWNRVHTTAINIQNFLGLWLSVGGAAAAWSTSNGYFVYTTNGGTSWSRNSTAWMNMRVCNPNGSGRGIATGWNLWHSAKTAGVLYLFCDTEDFWSKGDAYPEAQRYFKATGTSTWAHQQALFFAATPEVKQTMPYADSSGTPYAGDSRAYRIKGNVLFRTTAFPGIVVFNTEDWTTLYTGVAAFTDHDYCTWNENYQYLSEPTRLIATKNGWTSQNVTTLAGHSLYCLSALPYNASYCAAAGQDGSTQATVRRTVDGGDTWTDVTGNLLTVSGTATDVRTIAPDWIRTT